MSAEPSILTAFQAARTAEWRPGLPAEGAGHGEIFAPSLEGTGAALALALAMDRQRAAGAVGDWPDQRSWLWVQDAGALKRSGRPYHPGLPCALRHRLVHVAARSPEDALFAIEEGLRCRELAFVIGEIIGNPRALSFTASRRLSLAVEKHGVPLWLVRLDAARDLGSPRLRWEARAAASPSPRWNPQAPGTASWQAELFRARSHPPGEWVLHEDGGLVAERVAGTAPTKEGDGGGGFASTQALHGRTAPPLRAAN
jgi:protein ImuA